MIADFFDSKPRISIYLIIFLFLLIAISPMLDIWVSSLFFDDGFYLKDKPYFMPINKGIPEFLVLVAVMFCGFWGLGILRGKKWLFGIDTKKTILVGGSMFFGPALIVNGMFKSLWGRARPLAITDFGGDKDFSPAMVVSDQCHLDCSFVSGHTAVAFWAISLALLAPKKYRNLAVSFAIFFGLLTAFVRVAQGYHYFTDVFFSAIINFYIVWYLYYKQSSLK